MSVKLPIERGGRSRRPRGDAGWAIPRLSPVERAHTSGLDLAASGPRRDRGGEAKDASHRPRVVSYGFRAMTAQDSPRDDAHRIFGLSHSPFGRIEHPGSAWPRPTILEGVRDALCGGAAAVVVAGEEGRGKTSLIGPLKAALGARFTVGALAFEPDEGGFQSVLSAFEPRSSSLSRLEARNGLRDLLKKREREGRPCVLLIDDAHPHPRTGGLGARAVRRRRRRRAQGRHDGPADGPPRGLSGGEVPHRDRARAADSRGSRGLYPPPRPRRGRGGGPVRRAGSARARLGVARRAAGPGPVGRRVPHRRGGARDAADRRRSRPRHDGGRKAPIPGGRRPRALGCHRCGGRRRGSHGDALQAAVDGGRDGRVPVLRPAGGPCRREGSGRSARGGPGAPPGRRSPRSVRWPSSGADLGRRARASPGWAPAPRRGGCRTRGRPHSPSRGASPGVRRTPARRDPSRPRVLRSRGLPSRPPPW